MSAKLLDKDHHDTVKAFKEFAVLLGEFLQSSHSSGAGQRRKSLC